MVILRNPYSKVDLKIGKWKLLSQNIDVIKITVENLLIISVMELLIMLK